MALRPQRHAFGPGVDAFVSPYGDDGRGRPRRHYRNAKRPYLDRDAAHGRVPACHAGIRFACTTRENHEAAVVLHYFDPDWDVSEPRSWLSQCRGVAPPRQTG